MMTFLNVNKLSCVLMSTVIGLLLCGCGERVIPVLVPVRAERVRPGKTYQALVVLPKKAGASVYLHFRYESGRVWISRIGVVNHHPDRVTVFFTKSRGYVDDGDSLRIVNYKDFNSK